MLFWISFSAQSKWLQLSLHELEFEACFFHRLIWNESDYLVNESLFKIELKVPIFTVNFNWDYDEIYIQRHRANNECFL